MKKNELIELLQRQNDFLQGKLDEALASVNSLTEKYRDLLPGRWKPTQQ